MRRPFLYVSLFALISCLAVAYVSPAGASDGRALPFQQETFNANAQAVGTGISGQTRVFITISRWSTDEERNELATVLAEQGSNALAEALAKQEETGFIRFPQVQTQFPSVRLRYAREFPTANGRTIILATDRPIGWAEAILRPQRTVNNQISLIQLDVDADGNGEGAMALGVELTVNEETNTLGISTISSQPIRLANVRH